MVLALMATATLAANKKLTFKTVTIQTSADSGMADPVSLSTPADVDVLVDFKTGHVPGLAFFTMQNELSSLLGRKVDLHTPGDLGRQFRDKVVAEAEVRYG